MTDQLAKLKVEVSTKERPMKFYIESFSKQDESFSGFIETDLYPEQVSNAYGIHPAGLFELTPEKCEHFGLKNLNFEAKDYFLAAIREHVDETYEYHGEKLYPPPMFLPDIFNAEPVPPGKDEFREVS